MNTYQLSGIPIPLNNDQGPNKLYVDTSITNLNINNYLTSASAVSTYATLTSLGSTNLNVANLLNTTQNLTATSSLTTSSKPLDMGVNKISSTYSPLISSDLTNKNYVDMANGLKLNISGGTLSGALTIQGTLTMGANAINCGEITASKFNANGFSTEFLKADGTKDPTTYLSSASVSNKLNIDGSIAMTGALNMGTNRIVNLSTPTSTTDAVTKQYTDNNDALKLNLSGGKMSGVLDMNFNMINSFILNI